MSKLTSKQRALLPNSSFAIPSERRYPIPDKSHARNALARVSANGSPSEKKEVRRNVHRRFPSLDGVASMEKLK